MSITFQIGMMLEYSRKFMRPGQTEIWHVVNVEPPAIKILTVAKGGEVLLFSVGYLNSLVEKGFLRKLNVQSKV